MDEFVGGAGNDTFRATIDNDGTDDNSTWTALDNLDGGAGNDTLFINNVSVDADDEIVLTKGTISNIETINIQSVFDVAATANALTALDFSSISGLETVNVTKAVNANIKVGSTMDANVSGVTGVTAVDGGENVTVNQKHAAASTIQVNNAENVTITATDSAAAAGGINVGAAAATGATGTVDITATGATLVGNDNAVVLDAITVFGGTAVNVTQVAAAGYGNAATKNADSNDIVTQGAVTITAGADTTDVTVVQDASRGAVDARAAVAGVAVTQEITFEAMTAGQTVTLDFSGGNTLSFTAKKALTAAQVASAFANLEDLDIQGSASATLGLYSHAGNGADADAGKWSSGAVVAVDSTKSKVVFTNTNSAVTDIDDAASTGGLNAVGAATAGTDAVTVRAGVTGIANGVVTINEDGVTDDNVTTITIDGYGNGSAIGTAKALSTLNLSNSGLTITANTGAVTAAAGLTVADTAATLALSLDAVGHKDADAALTLTAAPTTLNVTSTGDNYVNLTAAATKTLNVDGTGTLDADATDLAALETVVVSGAAGLKLNAGVADTVTSVNTSATTGAVSVTIDGTKATYTGGAGADTVTLTTGTALTKAIDLGAGDDTLIFDAAVTGSTATLSGGEGTDSLSMSVANADALDASVQTFYTNFERLILNDAAGSDNNALDTVTIDLANLGFTNYVTTNGTVLDSTTPASSDILLLKNMASNGTVVLAAAAAAANTQQTVEVKDAATGEADVLNVVTKATNGTNLGTLTADDVESININVVDTITTALVSTNTLELDADSATAIEIDGAGNLVLTLSAATTEVATIDASAMTGKLTATTNAGDTGATTVTGGSGADTLTAQGANDVLIGGAGNDTLIVTGAVASAVTLTGGEGTDHFDVSGFTAANGGSAVTITDFAVGETIEFATSATANFATGKVTLIAEATFSEYVQEAAAQADAAAEVVAGGAAAHGIAWFEFNNNTFIVQDVDGDGSFGENTDIIVKLNGVVDLSASSFNYTDGILEYVA